MPTWKLDFSRFRGDASHNVSPQQAFANAAVVEYMPDGSLHTLAAVSWLAVGPSFGLAVVQLDPAGQYREFVTLAPDPAVQSWQVGFELELPAACAPADAVGSADSPLGVTCGIGTAASLKPPILALDYWATPAGVDYITARTETVIMHPASGAVAVTVSGHPGWRANAGTFTAVVVPLEQGRTFICAADDMTARVEQIAANALA